jgi:hypothetical protein
MGTYEKTYVVDGEQYELYAESDADEVAYELFDLRGRKVTVEPLAKIPDQEAIVGLVRRWRAVVAR